MWTLEHVLFQIRKE